MKELMDTALIKVTGGNYGDSKFEHDHNLQLYKVGDQVEVFTDSFHTFTRHAVITNVTLGWVEEGHIWNRLWVEAPLYTVRYDDKTLATTSAKDIER